MTTDGDDGPGGPMLRYPGHTRVVQDNLTEVGWAQQSKISQHHQQPPTLQPNLHPPTHRLIQWMTDSAQTFNFLGVQPSNASGPKQHVDPMQTGPTSLYVSVIGLQQ